jgi:hypothetical protein
VSVMVLSQTSLLKTVIYALYAVASRRTSSKFAEETIETALETLRNRYPFFKRITIKGKSFSQDGLGVNFISTIDNVHISEIGNSIESLIRIVYNDLSEEAGLYFITEMKQHAGGEIVEAIIDAGVDLDQIQVEQHHAYMRRKRKKAAKSGNKAENLLGYTWGKVSRWEHKAGGKYCTLYDREGKVLDRIDLERVIQNYVETLSGVTETNPEELEKMVRIYEKEYSLLKMMYERDMDAETARRLLNITPEELDNIVKKLFGMEMIEYISHDTIKLTKTAVDYVYKEGD